MVFPVGVLGADEASFSVTSSKTSYRVGDEITVSLSVDAGTYATTLNVIDFDLSIDDTAVIEPSNPSSPFTAGSIYSGVGMQSYSDGLMNAVVYINPESQPANRSGLIGTVTFTALKVGRATLAYDRIEAAEENNETEFVNTLAGSLTIEVAAGDASSGSTDVSASTGTTGSTSGTSGAGTARATPVSSTSARTGPEHIILAVIIAGMIAYLGFSWYRGNKYYPKI